MIKSKHTNSLYRIAQQDLLIEPIEIQGKSAGQGVGSDSIAIPEVIPGVIPHRMQGRIPVAIATVFLPEVASLQSSRSAGLLPQSSMGRELYA
jgi:hypothetical protein